MPMDKVKNTRKGFCFITFEQESVVQDLIRTGKTKIKDMEVDVKKATPKPDGGRGGMRGAPRGGRGMGRGQGRVGVRQMRLPRCATAVPSCEFLWCVRL